MRCACHLGVSVTLVGCSSGTDESNGAHVREPPEVAITAPAEGAVFHQGGDPIGLVGTVHDSYDAPTALAVTWTLDGDVPIPVDVADDGAATATLDTTMLTTGEHAARLQAVDTDDATSFAHIGFVVAGPPGPPTVDITAPADGTQLELGNTITFLGAASDLATPPDALSYAWSSDLDGPLTGAIDDGGQSVLETSTLSEGTHRVTLDVTDSDGEVGEDNVTVAVVKTATPPLAFDAFLDFDAVTNDDTHVWQYGYAASTGAKFAPYTVALEEWPGFLTWTDDDTPDLLPQVGANTTGKDIIVDAADPLILPGAVFLQLHPGSESASRYSVLRFVVPASGVWTIDCAFKSLRPGTPPSTDAHVLVAGAEVFEAAVGGTYDTDPSAGERYVDALVLAAGDTIDFEVGPGPGADYNSDSTGLRASVTKD